MADRKPLTESQDPRVEAALREYLERKDQGQAVDPDQFLADHADIADELRSLLAADQQLAGLKSSGAPAPPQREVSTHSMSERGMETIIPQRVQDAERAPGKRGLPPQFGRYKVIRPLGSGAMGTVYLAEDSQLERNVALKTPSFEDDPSGELLQRFHREARSAANLRHSNICPVFDVGEIDGRHYISMAYIKGRPLSAYIQPDKPQPERNILILVRKMALALQEAHDHHIIHRDLKPGNVMVDEKGEPIIMDFGLARKVQKDAESRLTQSGMIVGSPAYMSPEQVEAESDKLTAAADQYSLGVILYELLTGKLPFRGGITAVIGAILTKAPTPVEELRQDVSPRVAALCARMMHKQADQRFPSCKAVADEIATILRDPRGATASATPDPQPATTSPSRRSSATQSTAAAATAATASITQSNVTSLYEAAQKCMRKHDYEQVVQMLDSLPQEKRTDEVNALLTKARGLADEVAFLLAEIDEAMRLNDNESLGKKADELLKLKPRHHKALQLKEELSRYGKGRIWKAGGYTPDGRRIGEGSWIPWIGIMVGLVVFGLTTWAVTIYLKAGDAVVRIQINDPDVEVSFQGRTLNVQSAGQELKVEPGDGTLTIRYGDAVFETDKFTLNKGDNPAVVIDLLDDRMAAKFGELDIGQWPLAAGPAATPPSVGQPLSIPADAVTFNGHFYRFYPDAMSWKQAKARCEAIGGKLVVIDSAEENAFVGGLIQAAGKVDAWIGATDEAREGEWLTVNGRPLTYTNWWQSQPNNKPPGEHFALMSNKLLANGGRMNWEWSDQPDVSEQHEPGYVCEWATFAGAASEAAPGWTDLLAQASLTPQTTLGEWTRNAQDSLTGLNTENGGRGGAPQIVFSDRPTGSYELETGIVFHSSRRAMLHFPAGNGMASLCYHFADGGVIWLDTDGVNDPTNLPPESTLFPFRMDEEFVGRIRVDVDGDQVQIAISVNGTDLPVYRGPSASLQAAVPRLPVPMLDRLTEQFAVMIGADSTTGATLTRFRYQPITSQSAPEREWTDLFNGSDLTGWKQVGDGGWTVQNGILTSQPGNGWIATEQEFDDFELQLEFRLSAGANSGVFLRFPDQGALSGGDFLEVQLIDDSKQPNAPAWQQTGAIYAVQGPTPPPNPAVGQWHQLTIHALGPEIVVSIDGREVNRVNLETAPVVGPPKRDLKRSRGHIGLQHRQPAEFRNIRIRELDPAAVDAPQAGAWSDLFNGRDLAGWRGRADLWRWDKGELVGSTAPNGLERFNSCLCSDRSYRDFEIEFEAKLQGTNPNSGLQIRSGTIDADNFVMAGPQVDIGGRLWGGLYGEQTGGIMQAADEAAVNRIIQPDDWHSVTVRCVGRHVTITVNGTITVDDEFPTIAAEGILGWQLHRGEAMTARFRNIRIRELSSEVTGAPSAPARPDDPIAPAQIPDDAVPFSGHAYKFFPEQLSWTEARTRCEALGGRLVIIDSAAENEFVARLIEAGGKVDAWIGITDEFEEGNWVSVDGQPLKFTNWIQGQPNNKQPGEHYGLVSNKILADGQRVGWEWSDQPNDSAQFAPGYICEWSEPANAAVNVPADGWFDLLAEVTPDAQNSRGTWTRTGAGYLAGDRKRSWLFPELSFSQRPAGSYELEVGLVFGEADHVILGLPAGSGMANLILIRSNEGSVVWQTGGEFSPATQPPDQRLKYALHPNTGYLLRVSVEVQPDGSRVRLSGTINGQSLPALSRDPADLTYVSPPRGLNLTPLSSLAANFGIHVGQGSTATLTRFRYR